MHDLEERTAKKEIDSAQAMKYRPWLMGQAAGAVTVI